MSDSSFAPSPSSEDPQHPEDSPESSVEVNHAVPRPFWREMAELLTASLLIALVARAGIAEPRYIPSESMLPTLAVNDKLIIEKISNYTQTVERGDILVFYAPDEAPPSTWGHSLRRLGLSRETPLIKRVVALPGETIAIESGRVWINGAPLHEPYLYETPSYSMAPQTVPDGHFFMLGDNRNNSADSHVWGPLPARNVLGHAAFRFWPLERVGRLQD